MALTGGCHCGAIRYRTAGKPLHHALCHCRDCRRHAGAPMVGWTMYKAPDVTVTAGTPKVYRSSEHGRRHFCADCGTGLFYVNEQVLPGIIDVQSATYDDPDAIPGASPHPGCGTHRLDAARARIARAPALPVRVAKAGQRNPSLLDRRDATIAFTSFH